MKKNLLLALCACLGLGYASADVTFHPVEQDTLYNYVIPTNGTQQIMYQHSVNVQGYTSYLYFNKFQPEFLVKAAQFGQGTEEGTGELPKLAKVIDIALKGYNVGDDTYQLNTLWIKNTESATLDKLAYTDYAYGIDEDMAIFSDEQVKCNLKGTEAAHDTIINTPLQGLKINDVAVLVEEGVGDYKLRASIDPFIYNGNNVEVNMWIENNEVTATTPVINYFYETYKYSESGDDVASTYRGVGNTAFGSTMGFNFNADTKGMCQEALGAALMYDIAYNTIPAFRMKYYTNDIFVTNLSNYPFTIYDEDGNVLLKGEGMAKGTSYVIYNVDHTKTYTVEYGFDSNDLDKETIAFTGEDPIWKDLEVFIDYPTAVEEVATAKQVAGVRYYNLAGQEMTEANGVTIVVTNYTDGSTTTTKVMK